MTTEHVDLKTKFVAGLETLAELSGYAHNLGSITVKGAVTRRDERLRSRLLAVLAVIGAELDDAGRRTLAAAVPTGKAVTADEIDLLRAVVAELLDVELDARKADLPAKAGPHWIPPVDDGNERAADGLRWIVAQEKAQREAANVRPWVDFWVRAGQRRLEAVRRILRESVR